MESILTSIKESLGIAEEYEHFDSTLIMHINSVFMDLTQIGVGPYEGFRIEDKTSVWTDFIPNSSGIKFEGVKSYLSLRVKLLFDPPNNSSQIESMNRQIERLEWRLNVNGEEEFQNG
jgi:hypothetical protein